MTTPQTALDIRATSADPAFLASRNPADPTDVVIELYGCGPETVPPAIERARTAQRRWAEAGAQTRASALRRAGDAIEASADSTISLMVRETGKPLAQARAEVAATVGIWRYYAQLALAPEGAAHDPASGPGLVCTRRRPHGVAGLITPWNNPLVVPSQKAAPALAAGNAAVLKPAPAATACALQLADILAKALPSNVFQVLPGGAQIAAEVAASTDVVSFTGSAPARSALIRAAADRGTPLHTEAGGHNTALVMPDADITQTARDIAEAIAGHAGQRCTATRQVITIGAAHPALRPALIEALNALPASNPTSPATVCGPLISSAARNSVTQARISATSGGARVLTGSGVRTGQRAGWYLDPVLLEASPSSHPLRGEEIFGPIAVLHKAQDIAHALHLANAGPRGLVTSLHTNDLNAALLVADRLDCGNLQVNGPTTHADPATFLAGEKPTDYQMSGNTALDFYTRASNIWLRPAARLPGRRPSPGRPAGRRTAPPRLPNPPSS